MIQCNVVVLVSFLDRDTLLTPFKLGLFYFPTLGCTGIFQQKLKRHKSVITILGQERGRVRKGPGLLISLCCETWEMPTFLPSFVARPRIADRISLHRPGKAT